MEVAAKRGGLSMAIDIVDETLPDREGEFDRNTMKAPY
jgi:hypothetical protein